MLLIANILIWVLITLTRVYALIRGLQGSSNFYNFVSLAYCPTDSLRILLKTFGKVEIVWDKKCIKFKKSQIFLIFRFEKNF